ncbi:MAG: alpha-L-rhamnosidase [Verrucomicrobia bacterium]|nr:alpha-L-rhamnosidase [Verrucomicrobiota bacterium]
MPSATVDDVFSAPCLWCPEAKPDDQDRYFAFRATLDIPTTGPVRFRLLGADSFVGWIDGRRFCEGPARFPKAFPEFSTFVENLSAGRHTLGVVVHHLGVSTRLLEGIDPFLACTVLCNGVELPANWKCRRLPGFAPAVRRINPQLGFIEWCDTRQNPEWLAAGFDDRDWSQSVAVERGLGPARPVTSANPRSLDRRLKPMASGIFTETFGYERDDIPARFFLRDLAPADLPAQGVWRRYDLGRVRLMRPRFKLDLPAGAVVEFAYAEALLQGRVPPWITLSGGDSCNLDHYVARGGPQEFSPLTPRGGRFLEIHVFASGSQATFLEEGIVERAYYGPAEGALQTDDPLLDRIWLTGVETHRACAEDAITDNPTRERGQWAGDVVTVGMDIAAAAFSDLRLCRRSLVQSAQCARADGLVSGLCPGGGAYLTTYAAQWVNACVHYWKLTGDRAHLEAMFPFAERNLEAFARKTSAHGIQDDLGWGFVDWGYVRNPGPSDMGVNLHHLAALRSMVGWGETLGRGGRAEFYRGAAEGFSRIIARYFAEEFSAAGEAWTRIGYHRAALGLRLGFFDPQQAAAGRVYLKEHMRRCFPNRADAPRLSDPAANNPQLITPYFGHFALPELIENGEMDFVLDQYRTCWGWSLGADRTTWLEVFDTRWSHCHQWAGCPTWQLSRYLLGLQPRFDLGPMHFAVSLATGSLARAKGSRPIPGLEEGIQIGWTKDSAGLHYHLETPVPLTLHLDSRIAGGKSELVAVERTYSATWPGSACS